VAFPFAFLSQRISNISILCIVFLAFSSLLILPRPSVPGHLGTKPAVKNFRPAAQLIPQLIQHLFDLSKESSLAVSFRSLRLQGALLQAEQAARSPRGPMTVHLALNACPCHLSHPLLESWVPEWLLFFVEERSCIPTAKRKPRGRELSRPNFDPWEHLSHRSYYSSATLLVNLQSTVPYVQNLQLSDCRTTIVQGQTSKFQKCWSAGEGCGAAINRLIHSSESVQWGTDCILTVENSRDQVTRRPAGINGHEYSLVRRRRPESHRPGSRNTQRQPHPGNEISN